MRVVTSHCHVRRTGSGFTMVELIVVLILIGILGAIGANRFFDRGTFDTSASAEQTRAMLRYAQKLAIARNAAVFAILDGTSLQLCFKNSNPCPANDQVRMPGSGDAGTPSPYSGDVSHFGFDALGRPIRPNGDALPGLTFKVSGDAAAPLITVATETGYVS